MVFRTTGIHRKYKTFECIIASGSGRGASRSTWGDEPSDGTAVPSFHDLGSSRPDKLAWTQQHDTLFTPRGSRSIHLDPRPTPGKAKQEPGLPRQQTQVP